MTTSKKQIILETTAILAAITMPIATIVSCGQKIKEGAIQINKGAFDGMGITWNVMNSYSTKYNVATEQLKKAKELAKKNNWQEVYSFKIKAEDYEISETMNKKTTDEINKKIDEKFNTLTDLHKRTLLFAATDLPDASGIKTSYNYYEIKVYDTLKENDKALSEKFSGYINKFLESSNIEANKYQDYDKLEVVKFKNKPSLEEFSTKRYISMSRSMRLKRDGLKWVYGNSFSDNGIFNNEQEMLKLRKDLGIDGDKSTNGVDVATKPVFNFNKGTFNQNIIFFEGVDFIEDTEGISVDGATIPKLVGGKIIGDTPQYENYKTVFTLNPVIQELGSGTIYDGVKELTFEQVKQYLMMIHDVLLTISKPFGGINSATEFLESLLPSIAMFIESNKTWILDIDDIKLKNKVKDNPKKTIEKTVNIIGKIIDSKKDEILKKIKDSNRISLKRIAYSYNRDLSDEMIPGLKATQKNLNLWKVKQFKGDYIKKEKELAKIFEDSGDVLEIISGFNTLGLSWLFDYLNTLSIVGETLKDGYESSNAHTTPSNSIY